MGHGGTWLDAVGWLTEMAFRLHEPDAAIPRTVQHVNISQQGC